MVLTRPTRAGPGPPPAPDPPQLARVRAARLPRRLAVPRAGRGRGGRCGWRRRRDLAARSQGRLPSLPCSAHRPTRRHPPAQPEPVGARGTAGPGPGPGGQSESRAVSEPACCRSTPNRSGADARKHRGRLWRLWQRLRQTAAGSGARRGSRPCPLAASDRVRTLRMREVPPASECDAAGTSPCASPGVAGMGQPTQPSSQASRDQRAVHSEASVEGRAASTGEGGRGRPRRDGRTRMRGTPPREVCLASESRTRKRGPARSRRRCSGQYRKGFRPLVQERIQRVLAVKAVGPKDCSGSDFAVRLGCWWRRTASAARAQTRIGTRIGSPADYPAGRY